MIPKSLSSTPIGDGNRFSDKIMRKLNVSRFSDSIRNDVILMPKTPEQLFAALDALGIAHRSVQHPPLFTVEQSRSLRGQIPGGHTKNLFLRDKKHALYLVVALEEAEIDLKGLHRRLGAGGRFSFGSADLLREVWGVEPGAVTPFGAINDAEARVTVVLDAAMMEHATLNYHPLVNTMTTTIARDDLVKFLESTGHVPRIERVSGQAADAC
jgi:Ala-tRNA(Pro) deacylase